MRVTSLLLMGGVAACSSHDEPLVPDIRQHANLLLSVSTTRHLDTRMPATATMGTIEKLDLDQLYIFTFDTEGEIGLDTTPLEESVKSLSRIGTTSYFFDDTEVVIPDNTASYLCYCKETGGTGDKFKSGMLTASNLTASKPNTSSITFSLEVIYSDTAVDAKATAIAEYLTNIARAIPSTDSTFFREYINEGHPIAASSTNVQKLADWAQTDGGVTTLPKISNEESITGYPANINLPDGAAVVKWNFTEKKFEPQIQTTTEANINSLDRFVYPAELWYYANSRIKTSSTNQRARYEATPVNDWNTILGIYEKDNGVMDGSVQSVAIKDPLNYAVGCLEIGMTVKSSLEDAEGNAITPVAATETSPATFPLTAIFVSGQYQQAFNFTPVTDETASEYIIYDKEIEGISMGGSLASTPSKYTSTLVLQTKEHTNVRFALEFENNSGQDFEGANGTVFNDTKFYLVGTIAVPSAQTTDYRKRAFTKDYFTRGTVTINSLKQAYTYLPDLLNPRLEAGVQIVLNWIGATPTSIPL